MNTNGTLDETDRMILACRKNRIFGQALAAAVGLEKPALERRISNLIKYGYTERMSGFGLHAKELRSIRPRMECEREPTERRCLGGCGCMFMSVHPKSTHRICDSCKGKF